MLSFVFIMRNNDTKNASQAFFETWSWLPCWPSTAMLFSLLCLIGLLCPICTVFLDAVELARPKVAPLVACKIADDRVKPAGVLALPRGGCIAGPGSAAVSSPAQASKLRYYRELSVRCNA